jgi:hypothetical protein
MRDQFEWRRSERKRQDEEWRKRRMIWREWKEKRRRQCGERRVRLS